MTIACQEIISQGHKHPDQVRIAVYKYSISLKDSDDGNDSDEMSREEPILTLKRFHGRTSDNPRRHFRMYKDNGEIDHYGKHTLDTLLTKEGTERELFYPKSFAKSCRGISGRRF